MQLASMQLSRIHCSNISKNPLARGTSHQFFNSDWSEFLILILKIHVEYNIWSTEPQTSAQFYTPFFQHPDQATQKGQGPDKRLRIRVLGQEVRIRTGIESEIQQMPCETNGFLITLFLQLDTVKLRISSTLLNKTSTVRQAEHHTHVWWDSTLYEGRV